jgi:hypothetical protein
MELLILFGLVALPFGATVALRRDFSPAGISVVFFFLAMAQDEPNARFLILLYGCSINFAYMVWELFRTSQNLSEKPRRELIAPGEASRGNSPPALSPANERP